MTISEGAHPTDGTILETGDADAYGHRKLGGIGYLVAQDIKRLTRVDFMYEQLTYIMRTGAPDSLDRMVAACFGTLALDQLAKGIAGRMVALQQGVYTTVPIGMVVAGKKCVDVAALYDTESYRPRMHDVLGKPMFLYLTCGGAREPRRIAVRCGRMLGLGVLSARPHRPEAQDAALSRPKHGFESRWGRHRHPRGVYAARLNWPLYNSLKRTGGVATIDGVRFARVLMSDAFPTETVGWAPASMIGRLRSWCALTVRDTLRRRLTCLNGLRRTLPRTCSASMRSSRVG